MYSIPDIVLLTWSLKLKIRLLVRLLVHENKPYVDIIFFLGIPGIYTQIIYSTLYFKGAKCLADEQQLE